LRFSQLEAAASYFEVDVRPAASYFEADVRSAPIPQTSFIEHLSEKCISSCHGAAEGDFAAVAPELADEIFGDGSGGAGILPGGEVPVDDHIGSP
jgi:hypothetical protein